MRTGLGTLLVLLPFSGLADEQTDPPACSVVCNEVLMRGELSVARTQTYSRDQFETQLREINKAAHADNFGTWYGGQAARYIGTVVATGDNPAMAAVGKLIEDSGNAAVELHGETVAYALALAANKEIAANLLLPNGRFDLATANSMAASLADPSFLNSLPKETREALEPVRDKITISFLSNILSNGLSHSKEIGAIGMDLKQANSAIKRYESLAYQHRDALQSLKILSSEHLALTQKLERDQREWRNITSQTMPASQQLQLYKSAVIERSEGEIAILEKIAEADRIKAQTVDIVGKLQGLSSALEAAGAGEAAALINKGANLVAGIGTFAAGYATGNPISMAQGAFATFGALKSFSSKPKPSPEAMLMQQVLVEMQEFRVEVQKNFKEVKEALETISYQIAALNAETLNNFDHTLYAVSRTDAGVMALLQADTQQCVSILESFQTKFDTALLQKVSLDQSSSWFAANVNPGIYTRCLGGLNAQTGTTSGIGISPIFEFKYGDQNIASNTTPAPGGTQNQRWAEANAFIQQHLIPLSIYASNYTKIDPKSWNESLALPLLKLTDVYSLKAASADKKPSSAALLPAGEMILSPDRVREFTSLVRAMAPFTILVNPATNAIYSDEEIKRCIATIGCSLGSDNGAQWLRRTQKLIDTAIRQEVLLSGAPLLSTMADEVENRILPAFDQERAGDATKPLTVLLAGTDAGSVGYQKRSTCTTGNITYDTLCLMQNNPTIAQNVVNFIAYRRITTSTDNTLSAVDYRSSVLSIDARKVLYYWGPFAHMDDSGRRLLPPDKRANALTWGLQLPRLEALPYGVAASPNRELATVPSSCWHSIPSKSLPAPADYLHDARWATCVAVPATIEGERPLEFRKPEGSTRSYLADLLELRIAVQDTLWLISSPNPSMPNDAIARAMIGRIAALPEVQLSGDSSKVK